MTKAVLIVGHGSRLMFNKMTMEYQADLLRRRGFENVYIGFNETSIPSIEDAMVTMADDGVDEVVAIPFFIASGLHMTRDIPPKLGLKDGQKEGIVEINGRKMKMHLDAPFGEDENLTDILCEKIDELAVGDCKRGIIVMGHGSRLNFNYDIMELNAKRLRERGYGDVRIGFNEFNDPKIEDTIKAMIDDGLDEIIALPLFISKGVHLCRDIPSKLGIQEKTEEEVIEAGGRTVKVKYATPVGGDPRLSGVLEKKILKYFPGGPQKILILDMTHGGQILSYTYKERGDDVTCADVYKIAPDSLKRELSKAGIKVTDDTVKGDYDLVVMPCHCPDMFLKNCTYRKRIYFSDAVREFTEMSGCTRIEITGVKGKTSTCYVLADILATAGKKVYLSTSRGRGPWKDGKIDPMENCSIAPPYLLTLPVDGYDVVIGEVSLGGSGKADIAGITNLVEDYGIAKDTRRASEAKKAVLCAGVNIVDEKEVKMWSMVSKGRTVGYGTRIRPVGKARFGEPLKVSVDYGGIWETELRGDYLALQYLKAMDMAMEIAWQMGIPKEAVKESISGFGGVPGRGEIFERDGVRHVIERNPGISRLSVDKTLALLDQMDLLDNAVMVVDPVSRKVCDKMHMPEIEAEASKYGVDIVITDGSGARPDLPINKTTVIEFIKEGYQ